MSFSALTLKGTMATVFAAAKTDVERAISNTDRIAVLSFFM